MKTYIQDGDTLPLTAPYDVPAGGGMLVGGIFAVAIAAALSGAGVQGRRKGVIDLAKTASQAWTQGALLYWDNTAKSVTNSSNAGANKPIGAAAQAQASNDAVGRVLLTGQVS